MRSVLLAALLLMAACCKSEEDFRIEEVKTDRQQAALPFKACRVDADCIPLACGPCEPGAQILTMQPACTVNPCRKPSAVCGPNKVCVVGPGTSREPSIWGKFGERDGDSGDAEVRECGAGPCVDELVSLQASFGTTQYLPLQPKRTLAADYVPNSERVVPMTVSQCGGVQAHYRWGTHGAAALTFRAPAEEAKRATVIRWIQSKLPQVRIEVPAFEDDGFN